MKQLFEQCKIGGIALENRLMRSATWERMADEKGHLTEPLRRLYVNLAKSGIGLISTGYTRVLEEEQPNPQMMGIYDDSFVDEYRELVEAVHKEKAKILMQLAYGGTKTDFRVGERVIYSPDIIPGPEGVEGTPASREDIARLVKAYVDAAFRVKEAGFDAVQIHLAHHYLLNQFLSPHYNQRKDEYGGSLENRMRIVREIYEAVRERVGRDFPVWVKITCADFMADGSSFEEIVAMCREYEKWGIDAIEVSGNIHGKAEKLCGKIVEGKEISKKGYFYEFAKVLAREVKIPVILTGGIRNPEDMEEMLYDSGIQGFGLCRPLLAEPELVKRWKTGDRSSAKCVHCSKCRTKDGNHCVVFKESAFSQGEIE